MSSKESEWFVRVNTECKGKYKYAICPFFKGNKCSMYSKRFSCCRNFPHKGGCCEKHDCLLAKIRKGKSIKNKIGKDSISIKEICARCRNNCCESIIVPKEVKVTKAFIRKWLGANCRICMKFFK